MFEADLFPDPLQLGGRELGCEGEALGPAAQLLQERVGEAAREREEVSRRPRLFHHTLEGLPGRGVATRGENNEHGKYVVQQNTWHKGLLYERLVNHHVRVKKIVCRTFCLCVYVCVCVCVCMRERERERECVCA